MAWIYLGLRHLVLVYPSYPESVQSLSWCMGLALIGYVAEWKMNPVSNDPSCYLVQTT